MDFAHSPILKFAPTAAESRGISTGAPRSQKSAGSCGSGESLDFVAGGTLPAWKNPPRMVYLRVQEKSDICKW